MNNSFAPSAKDGFSSVIKAIDRLTGYVQADLLFDALKRAAADDRKRLARAFAKAAGKGRGSYPTYISALQTSCALDFVCEVCSESVNGAFSGELIDIARQAESSAVEAVNSRVFEDWAPLSQTEETDRPAPWGAHDLLDFAELIGRFSDVPAEKIVERLRCVVSTDADLARLRGSAELGQRSRYNDRAACEDRFEALVDERYDAALPFFEAYDVDPVGFSPSPPDYYSAQAEREAADRRGRDRDTIAEAQAKAAALRDAFDPSEFLAIVRQAARGTLSSGLKLSESLIAAAGIRDLTHRFRWRVETSIEAAREYSDQPYDDEATALRVAEIERDFFERFSDEPNDVAEASKKITAAWAAAEPSVTQEEAAVPSFEAPPMAPSEPLAFVPPPRSTARSSTDERFEALTYVPGFVGEIVDFIEASAETPNRTLALAAALAFVGTLAGRQYATPGGLRTNVYTLGLAPSGFGKEHARACLKTLAAKCGLTRFFGGSDIESGSGMRRRVEGQASIIWMIDEFGKFVRKIANPKTSHSYQITKYLLEYFSTASSTFFGSDYAGEPGAPCHNPNVSVYGTSTPRDFWQSVESISVADGLLPRILVFTVDGGAEPPDDVRPTMAKDDPPQALIDGCRRLVKPQGGGNLRAVLTTDGSQPYKAQTVPYGVGAEDAYFAHKKAYKLKAHRAEQHGEIFSRVVENAMKIALIVAIGIDPDRPVLSVELIDHGVAIADLCATKTLSEISGRLADNDRQREHIDIYRWIVEAGEAGASRTELSRRVRGRFDSRRLDDILKTLENDEKTVATKLSDGRKAGPRGLRYFAARFTQLEESHHIELG